MDFQFLNIFFQIPHAPSIKACDPIPDYKLIYSRKIDACLLQSTFRYLIFCQLHVISRNGQCSIPVQYPRKFSIRVFCGCLHCILRSIIKSCVFFCLFAFLQRFLFIHCRFRSLQFFLFRSTLWRFFTRLHYAGFRILLYVVPGICICGFLLLYGS